jgi:hypothetical protein
MSQVLTNAKVAADTIVFTITNGQVNFDLSCVKTHPGGKTHFRIDNNDAVGYRVRIPFSEFQPYADGPQRPLDEAVSGLEFVNVDPKVGPNPSNGTLTYVIKPAAHFPPKKTFKYKYNLYYAKAASNDETQVDPDLEVSS